MTTTEYAAMIEAARQEGREKLAAMTRERDLFQRDAETAYDNAWADLRRERDEARSALLAADDRAIEARAEGERLGVAKVLKTAEELSYPVGVMGGRAVDVNELRAHVREHSEDLTRLIAEKQAEALEAEAEKLSRRVAELADELKWRNDYKLTVTADLLEDVEHDMRERAAAYRKGGAP